MKPGEILLLADEKGAVAYELAHLKLLDEMAMDIFLLKEVNKGVQRCISGKEPFNLFQERREQFINDIANNNFRIEDNEVTVPFLSTETVVCFECHERFILDKGFEKDYNSTSLCPECFNNAMIEEHQLRDREEGYAK